MRPRAPRSTQKETKRQPKRSPRAAKLRRRQAQEAPKPLQKRAWGLPKQAWGMILVRSFIQKAPTAIFCYLWRRTPKPLNSRQQGEDTVFARFYYQQGFLAAIPAACRKMPSRAKCVPTYGQLGAPKSRLERPKSRKKRPKGATNAARREKCTQETLKSEKCANIEPTWRNFGLPVKIPWPP